MYYIYGIKTCDSVKKALKFFNDNNITYNYIDLREDGLSDEKVDYFVSKCDINLLFNSKGTKYRQLKLKDLNLDEKEKTQWLKNEPMLFKRPIIEYGEKVLCAFDKERYIQEFL